MAEDNASLVGEHGYSQPQHQRRHPVDHHRHVYGYANGVGGGSGRDSAEVIGGEDDGAVRISHRVSGINFTPTLHDSLVNEIRKLRNKLDKRENEVKLLNEELDILRESHENLQETHDSLASSSSRDIRSLRAQLERNAAVHVSEIKSLRSELQDTTSVVHDLRGKLDLARRAKSLAEEQRDKALSELDDLRVSSNSVKLDLERRLGREVEKVKVLEDLVAKMETEIERSTMSVKSGSDGRMSVEIQREEFYDEESDESHSPSAKHNDPGSPVKTLFAEMAGMGDIEEESDEEERDELYDNLGPLRPESSISLRRPESAMSIRPDSAMSMSGPVRPDSSISISSVAVAQVLRTLRETIETATTDRAIQTETPPKVPAIRILSPTPPLTNAPLIILPEDHRVETVDQSTQTTIPTHTQSTQTDPSAIPVSKPTSIQLSPPPQVKSPILRPQNSIRRGSHSVRWQEDKSIQTDTAKQKSVEIAIQTDPLVIPKALKPVLKTPTSEVKETEKEKFVRHGHLKSYDGPSRPGSAKASTTRRLAAHRGSILFETPPAAQQVKETHVNGHIGGHERRTSGSTILGQHSRKVSGSQSHNDLRRGRPTHPSWVKQRTQPPSRSTTSGIQLHTPTGTLPSSNTAHPPLPIPQRSSSKFRVVLPIIHDRSFAGPEESLPEVAEEVDEALESAQEEEERTRRELNAFLARPPRKTVRQIRSAINLRPTTSQSPLSTPDQRYTPPENRYPHDPRAILTPPAELAPIKAFSTPRRGPKRLVKLRVPGQETPVSSVSPASSYFPTSEEMSVVDEIARCMVGEFMYKYVRRRRRGSFTWRRSPARQTGNGGGGYNDDVEESTVRHKRWVWLQPMIMWSSTQPSQSNFLQRAQVKKRVVTGVLDVRDDTPLMTSGSTSQLPSLPHNRSIVVLTPTQAIKFTALSRERHISWLTALTFLVHNDPADLIIPRSLTTSPSNTSSLWAPRDPIYPPSGTTASSIASSQTTSHTTSHYAAPHPYPAQGFGSYNVRKNSLPEFVPPHAPREETSPLGYKYRLAVEEYAKPPSVPRIPTGRRFEIGNGRERSGSGSGFRGGGVGEWDEPMLQGMSRETIRMDAFVSRTPPRLDVDIDDSLFREF